MKVLLIAGFFESVVTFRGRLIDALLAAGCEVQVAAPDMDLYPRAQRDLILKGVVLHNISVARTGKNPLSDLRFLLALLRLMLMVRPDVVLPYTVKPVIYGTLAAWCARVPRRFALVTGLGFAFTGERKGATTWLVSFLYKQSLNLVGKVFFQNPDDRNLFLEKGILSADKPAVVLNGSGVDVDAFVSHAIPKGAPGFLMIARLLGDKGVREYGVAAGRVRAVHPETRFGLVGWIDANPDSISQVELDQWVASGDIEFYGKLADVRPSIAACSVYVLPSYREGTPRTVLEAMAMGRAIITTDAPGCRETVVDGDNGFLVPVQSVDALVKAMLKFIEDPALASRMGKRSREIAVEKYDVHKVNAVMLREMGIAAVPESVAGAV